MFYTARMPRTARKPAADPPTLSLKIGQWFEANASGWWGVLAVPVTVLLVLAAALLRGLV
jgi:hypothetical protein